MNVLMIGKGPWQAGISPEYGGNVVSLRYEGRDVLVPRKAPEQLKVNPYLQGAPILLPANRTKEGRFTFHGREYQLPVNEPYTGAHLHGLVHRQIFRVLRHSKTEITLEYVNRGEVYPFDFTLEVTYRIQDDGFEQHYALTNNGDYPMPLTFALHTTFVEPESFRVDLESCQKKDEYHIPTGEYVRLNDQEIRYVTSSPSKGIVISGYYKASGNTAQIGEYEYTVSENFDHWILFNGKGESGLLCVEPQCGAVDGLNMKEGHKKIAPGDTILFRTEIKRKA